MKTILLAAVIIECVLLILLSLLKKLTKPAFYVISALTILCCVGIWLAGRQAESETVKTDVRSRVYMAARLIEENCFDKSLEVLSDVADEEVQQYQGRAVRALGYNLNGAFQTLEYYLQSLDAKNEFEQIVLNASQRKEAVEPTDREKIISASLSAIHASDPETQQWETEMKVRFMGFIPAEKEVSEIIDPMALIKLAVTENRYNDAYNQAAAAAENGDIRAAVLVSEMYATNFQKLNLADTDSEYALLWQRATELRSDLNMASLALVGENVSEEQENEYDLLNARYELAMTDLSVESVKRAVNYLEKFDASDSPDQLGYQLQLARLAFMEGRLDDAKKLITDIFTSESLDNSQWLGQDCAMLREAYIRYLSDQTDSEYSMLFDHLMLSLYQSVFMENRDAAFREFVMSCMKSIFGGMAIRTVSTAEFPQIIAEVSATNPNLELNAETILLYDTGKAVHDYSVVAKEIKDLSISFVLDKSGSMSGMNIAESKQAIRNCISQMKKGVYFSLVTFENAAFLPCALTDSSYLIMSTLETVDADGGTNIAAGLKLGTVSLNQAKGEKIIILLSDGLDNNASKNLMDSVLNDAVNQNITVYSIGLEGCDEEYLKKIADRTGGQFVMVSDPTQLENTYQDIQNAIMNSYFLNYQADGQEENRSIIVRLNNSFAEARKNYQLSDQDTPITYYENGLQESGYFRQSGGTDPGRE